MVCLQLNVLMIYYCITSGFRPQQHKGMSDQGPRKEKGLERSWGYVFSLLKTNVAKKITFQDFVLVILGQFVFCATFGVT